MPEKYGLSREELDAFALESHNNAIAATASGAFKNEVVALEMDGPEGTRVLHQTDEDIRFDGTPESIGSVKLLQEGGRITAANASQICDGVSGALVVSEQALKEHNLTLIARFNKFPTVLCLTVRNIDNTRVNSQSTCHCLPSSKV